MAFASALPSLLPSPLIPSLDRVPSQPQEGPRALVSLTARRVGIVPHSGVNSAFQTWCAQVLPGPGCANSDGSKSGGAKSSSARRLRSSTSRRPSYLR